MNRWDGSAIHHADIVMSAMPPANSHAAGPTCSTFYRFFMMEPALPVLIWPLFSRFGGSIDCLCGGGAASAAAGVSAAATAAGNAACIADLRSSFWPKVCLRRDFSSFREASGARAFIAVRDLGAVAVRNPFRGAEMKAEWCDWSTVVC